MWNWLAPLDLSLYAIFHYGHDIMLYNCLWWPKLADVVAKNKLFAVGSCGSAPPCWLCRALDPGPLPSQLHGCHVTLDSVLWFLTSWTLMYMWQIKTTSESSLMRPLLNTQIHQSGISFSHWFSSGDLSPSWTMRITCFTVLRSVKCFAEHQRRSFDTTSIRLSSLCHATTQ